MPSVRVYKVDSQHMVGVRLPRLAAGYDRRIGLAWMTQGHVIPLIQNMVIEDTSNLHIFPLLIISSPHGLSLFPPIST